MGPLADTEIYCLKFFLYLTFKFNKGIFSTSISFKPKLVKTKKVYFINFSLGCQHLNTSTILDNSVW